MAKEYSLTIAAQPYWGSNLNRTVNAFFSIPDQEVMKEKGIPKICMLISGFLSNAAYSNVFKKMRNQFADKYNFVMVQCNYFGYEFMSRNLKTELIDYVNMINTTFTPEKWKEVEENDIELSMESQVTQKETKDYFCEMGIFQAMDCVRSLKAVMEQLDSMEIRYDPVITTYGNSQGAYLSYIMNAFYPNLISNIIDNSAWLFPNYFVNPLSVWVTTDVLDPKPEIAEPRDIAVNRHFCAMDIIDDIDIYYLPLLYLQFKNNAQIICFHGMDDFLIKIEDKMKFIQKVDHVDMNIITSFEVDNEKFTNAEHGLGADFLKLFDYVMETKPLKVNPNIDDKWKSNEFKSEAYRYWCSLDDGLPTIHRS